MDKCIASENGVCKSLFISGKPCDGYDDKCKMKPDDIVRNMAKHVGESIERCFRTKCDKE